MANEEEVVKAVKSVNVANVQVVDTAKMSFTEQLTLIRNTNVLIGIHGAGLMFIMFAAEEVSVT
jgi:capsular polysaccharide biosynthesis protein